MRQPPKDKPRVSHKTMLYFSEEQWQRLAALSDRTGAPISELVRRAVEAYLKEQKQ
jgi:predicted DNA-binding protein